MQYPASHRRTRVGVPPARDGNVISCYPESAPQKDAGSILLVEDEAELSELLRSMLRHQGFDLVIAGSLRSALQLAKGISSDLVVLTCTSPTTADGRCCNCLEDIVRFL